MRRSIWRHPTDGWLDLSGRTGGELCREITHAWDNATAPYVGRQKVWSRHVESGHDGWTALSDERSRFRDCIAHPWVSDVGSDVKGVRITVIRRTRLKGDVGMPVRSQVRSGWRRSCFRLSVRALMALIVIIGSGLGWIACFERGPTRRRRRDHTGWRRGLLRRSGSPPFFGRLGEPVARVVGDRVAPRMGHEASGRRVLADGRAGRAWGFAPR